MDFGTGQMLMIFLHFPYYQGIQPARCELVFCSQGPFTRRFGLVWSHCLQASIFTERTVLLQALQELLLREYGLGSSSNYMTPSWQLYGRCCKDAESVGLASQHTLVQRYTSSYDRSGSYTPPSLIYLEIAQANSTCKYENQNIPSCPSLLVFYSFLKIYYIDIEVKREALMGMRWLPV